MLDTKVFMIVCFMLLLSGCSQKEQGSLVVTSDSQDIDTSMTLETKSSSESYESVTSDTESSYEFNTDVYDYWLNAAKSRDLDQIKALIQENIQGMNERDDAGNTALMIATQDNSVEIAKYLIDANADVNVQNMIEDSPFLYAGAEGRTEILDYMLQHANIDFSITNRFGGNALIPAAEKGHIDNVRLLLEDGRSQIDFQNNYGYTALIEAVGLNDGSKIYQDITQLLVDYGADISIRDSYGMNALDYAIDRNQTEIISILKNVNL